MTQARAVLRIAFRLAGAVFPCTALAVNAATTFTAGNVFVLRVGDGVNALSDSAVPGQVEEYTPGGALVSTVPLPTTASGANKPITFDGSAPQEGLMTMSPNNTTLVIPGYAATVGTASVASSFSILVNRVVARVNASHAVDSATRFDGAFDGDSIRGAGSSDGVSIWAAGSGNPSENGVWYIPGGGVGGNQIVSQPGMRAVAVFGGQLYASAGQGVSTVGTGLPTTPGQTLTLLPGQSNLGAAQFALLDTNPAVPGIDRLYVAVPSGITKWTFDGGTWTSSGTVPFAGAAGVAAVNQPPPLGVLIFATNGATLARIVDTDTGSWNATPVTTLATAPPNTAFRGVAISTEGLACDLDVDGDGKVDPLTDGLLMMRAMFGLTGSAVTSNAVGQGALRQDWPSIRAFLNGSCRRNYAE